MAQVTSHPSVVVVAGPNGAGKSSSAPKFLRDTLAVREFVNADVIASGLAGFEPERAAVAAGRLMLQRLSELAEKRRSFAFETTLSSRAFAPQIQGWMRSGYRFHLVSLWLRSVEVALARVAGRVRAGGHDIPAQAIRRRYERGLKNLLRLYIPMATSWSIYDNSSSCGARCVARGGVTLDTQVLDSGAWTRIESHARE